MISVVKDRVISKRAYPRAVGVVMTDFFAFIVSRVFYVSDCVASSCSKLENELHLNYSYSGKRSVVKK